MPFDAGVTAAAAAELAERAVGAKIEKIQQPEKDELILSLKNGKDSRKLLLCAKAGSARLGFTTIEKESPLSAPMFCMLLRKHLSGGVIGSVSALGFERAAEIGIHTYNEFGFPTEKYLIFETTGRYSNIILCDGEHKVISALRLSELASDEKRKLLCGFRYEPLPLPEHRMSPLALTKETFLRRLAAFAEQNGGEYPCDQYLLSAYAGLSPLTAREIVYRTAGETGATVSAIAARGLNDNLFLQFESIYKPVEKGIFSPTLLKKRDGEAFEFSFCDILQYGTGAVSVHFDSISTLMDEFFGSRDLRDRIRQKSQDIFRLLSNAETRIRKKEEMQRADLAACAEKEKFKKCGDLITANMYQLKKGDISAKVIDYEDETMPECEIELAVNLTPSQNAQRYYKKYNKMKSAQENLQKQLAQSTEELSYIDTIFESLTKARNEKDLEEIRDELRAGGYGKKLDSLSKSKSKLKKVRRNDAKKTYSPMEFRTSGGYRVLCGKNNLQNDYITTVLGGKNDYWFHIKGMPGSHTVLFCGNEEPSAEDFTECAEIAAFYSSGRKIPNAAVDYTRIRNIRKPSGAKPGFVVYETNYSAYVTANEEKIKALQVSE